MEFLKKKILVVGLGKSGLSASRWLIGKGAYVTIGDIKSPSELEGELYREALELGAKLETGEHRLETFVDSDLIIVSPGVPLDAGPLRAAAERGIPVIGEMELAVRLFDTPVVAVTGTNGKTTAVSMLELMISESGASLFVGGNIGTPLMDYVAGNRDADYVLVEVSSFQLDAMEQFRPLVSLLLNVSPDHLERYADYEAYVRSKLKIFQNQGPGHYAVLNDDDERLSSFRPGGGVSVLRYGIEERDGRNAFLDGKRLIARLPEKEEFSFDMDKFRLPGRHNIENLMGVVLVGLALGIKPDVMEGSIIKYKGLPHRIELVGSVRGIDFYDDSKATNVDAASKSVCSFEKPLILIAGGRHKGGDYAPLVSAAKGRVRKVILLGESRHLMARSFEGIIPFNLADTMKEAVSQAVLAAKANDVVLLAPACSSFDMFSDYAHRGRIFREEVKGLSNGG
ncbi:UDP-N-acetylmuramoyl-L-alanine--D-glutamate ligase [Deltaproteobacteria bacterium]|nr:UDP-N-acetylmuramoyl-L-alanine--D-glutamate ligase [Deltaproteobacteria bacterium]